MLLGVLLLLAASGFTGHVHRAAAHHRQVSGCCSAACAPDSAADDRVPPSPADEGEGEANESDDCTLCVLIKGLSATQHDEPRLVVAAIEHSHAIPTFERCVSVERGGRHFGRAPPPARS